MPHKKLILVLVLAVATAAVLAGVALARRDSAPAPAVDRQLREAVARYEAAKNPVRPAKLYGATLTLPRCITLMNAYSSGVRSVAAGEAAKYADYYWPLRQVKWDEARVQRSRGPNALPVARRLHAALAANVLLILFAARLPSPHDAVGFSGLAVGWVEAKSRRAPTLPAPGGAESRKWSP